MLSWQCVTWYPLDFPSLPWLSDLVQLLQFDCQALAAAEAAQRRRSFRVAVEQDEQVGFSRQGYRSIRPASKPPFTAVSTEVEQPLQCLTPATLGEWECSVPKPSLFRPGMPATVGGVEGLVVEVRASSFIGDISEPVWSSTGAPEGDGVSVAAAVAIGWLYSQVIEDYGLSPMMFVDNWAWVSEDHELNTAGVEQTVRFAAALKLSVDWSKSFGWSRHPEGRRWWHESCETAGPPGITLHVLPEAKDLGAAMRYCGPRTLGALKARMQDAQQRLHRLAAQPRSVRDKAKLVQGAIWPVAFFASEGHAIGLQKVATLRSIAARAMVGPFRQLSPYLALSTLSPRGLPAGCSPPRAPPRLVP